MTHVSFISDIDFGSLGYQDCEVHAEIDGFTIYLMRVLWIKGDSKIEVTDFLTQSAKDSICGEILACAGGEIGCWREDIA